MLWRFLSFALIVASCAVADQLDDARQLFQQKKYADAARAVETYLEREPSSVEALILAGDIAVQLEKPDKALDYYRRAYQRDRENSLALRKYARLLSGKGSMLKHWKFSDVQCGRIRGMFTCALLMAKRCLLLIQFKLQNWRSPKHAK